VRARLLGSVRRGTGPAQVSYGGHPLYSCPGDRPEELLCHDVADHGGRWFAVSARGGAVG
jgi:hypothetical protein